MNTIAVVKAQRGEEGSRLLYPVSGSSIDYLGELGESFILKLTRIDALLTTQSHFLVQSECKVLPLIK